MLCFFCFVALCHYSYVKRVSSECLCKSSVFVSLVFLRFSLESVSSAFVLPFAAILIAEAFVFAFVADLGLLGMLLIIKLELAIAIALKRRCEV